MNLIDLISKTDFIQSPNELEEGMVIRFIDFGYLYAFTDHARLTLFTKFYTVKSTGMFCHVVDDFGMQFIVSASLDYLGYEILIQDNER